ncbi:Protein NHR-1 d [Aphelenchoides avenae]|nr:Protein NHR-1 d [Aphelenchus avenae]
MSIIYAGIPSSIGFSQAPWLDHDYCSQSFNGSFTQPLEGYYSPPALTMIPVSAEQWKVTPYQPAVHSQTTSYQPAIQSPTTTTIVLNKSRKSTTKIVVETLCAICDATASGYHYDVASCTACWMFFRQMVITGEAERLQCLYQGTCVVNKDVRNACRHCRFNKCLLEGMDMAAVESVRDERSSAATLLTANMSSRPKVPEGTLCTICHDAATGYHYGVAACHACKTFFRRIIVTGDSTRIRCQHDGNCDVNKRNRNACRRCRFDKCQQAGMSIDALQGNRDRRGPYKKNAGPSSQQSVLPSMPMLECEPAQFFEALAARFA